MHQCHHDSLPDKPKATFGKGVLRGDLRSKGFYRGLFRGCGPRLVTISALLRPQICASLGWEFSTRFDRWRSRCGRLNRQRPQELWRARRQVLPEWNKAQVYSRALGVIRDQTRSRQCRTFLQDARSCAWLGRGRAYEWKSLTNGTKY